MPYFRHALNSKRGKGETFLLTPPGEKNPSASIKSLVAVSENLFASFLMVQKNGDF